MVELMKKDDRWVKKTAGKATSDILSLKYLKLIKLPLNDSEHAVIGDGGGDLIKSGPSGRGLSAADLALCLEVAVTTQQCRVVKGTVTSVLVIVNFDSEE